MKLLLADDHTLFRDALVQYIERSNPGASVSTAENFFQARDILKEDPHQDLVMLDLRMPGMDGLKGFEQMRTDYPDIPLALMSGVAKIDDVKLAMGMGASGYFPKTLSGKALLRGIEAVLAGETFLPELPDTKVIMPSYYDDGNQSDDPVALKKDVENFGLTPRETQVLGFLVKGASNKEIASALGLQVVTVKLHVRGICRKLDAKNRTQAALIAHEKGLGQEASVNAGQKNRA